MSTIGEFAKELRELVSSSNPLSYVPLEATHKILKAADVIEILHQKMELMKLKNGWIPCSEQLPEECEDVLVWYEYFRYGDYNCMFQTYGIGYHVEGHWRGDVNGVKARCIAWMPLPEPYHE